VVAVVVVAEVEATNMQQLGLGIGWRPELAYLIQQRSDLGFVELLAESITQPAPTWEQAWQQLQSRGVQFIIHGLSLSLGSIEPLDQRRLERLAQLAVRFDSPLVSEHLAFVRSAEWETGHLLPVARSQQMLDYLIPKLRAAEAALPVPLALENISSLIEWPESHYDEATFLRLLLQETNIRLLLDIENVYANALNHQFDPQHFLDQIPLERIAYVHVAGGCHRAEFYHDTHQHRIPDGVLQLLTALTARQTIPGVMLERDANFDNLAEINSELQRIKLACEQGRQSRSVVSS
jgi:uncharacterized protein